MIEMAVAPLPLALPRSGHLSRTIESLLRGRPYIELEDSGVPSLYRDRGPE